MVEMEMEMEMPVMEIEIPEMEMEMPEIEMASVETEIECRDGNATRGECLEPEENTEPEPEVLSQNKRRYKMNLLKKILQSLNLIRKRSLSRKKAHQRLLKMKIAKKIWKNRG